MGEISVGGWLVCVKYVYVVCGITLTCMHNGKDSLYIEKYKRLPIIIVWVCVCVPRLFLDAQGVLVSFYTSFITKKHTRIN